MSGILRASIIAFESADEADAWMIRNQLIGIPCVGAGGYWYAATEEDGVLVAFRADGSTCCWMY